MSEFGRRLTPFEQRLATAIRSAAQIELALRRDHVPGWRVEIYVGEAAYAEARSILVKGSVYAEALQTMFGYPVVIDDTLMPNQIQVRATTNIA